MSLSEPPSPRGGDVGSMMIDWIHVWLGVWMLGRVRLGGGAVAVHAGARRHPQAMLWARAYHCAVALTFSTPRLTNRVRPRLRACALTHSAVAAPLLVVRLPRFDGHR